METRMAWLRDEMVKYRDQVEEAIASAKKNKGLLSEERAMFEVMKVKHSMQISDLQATIRDLQQRIKNLHNDVKDKNEEVLLLSESNSKLSMELKEKQLEISKEIETKFQI